MQALINAMLFGLFWLSRKEQSFLFPPFPCPLPPLLKCSFVKLSYKIRMHYILSSVTKGEKENLSNHRRHALRSYTNIYQ
mmetsp:Transcript_9229/g.12325  ORF Transcript_9229/g.12325 Transcript_9229/m.12325 type:complete len:80 (+) Transcript_9229:1029-1268(+)